MQSYDNTKWKTFRGEVIRLDGGVCVRCHRGNADGVVLQVHHKIYFPGLKPWEYDYECCETLCKGCHAEEHGKIPPRFGWEFIGGHDLEDLVGTCEFCGTAIRHVCLVQHEKWTAFDVGEVCCDNITCTQIPTDHVDSLP